MGVPAELHDEAGRRRRPEVDRHEVRGAAIERERRLEHAADPDGHEPLLASAVAGADHLDRVRTVVGGSPSSVRRSRHAPSQRLAHGFAFLTRRDRPADVAGALDGNEGCVCHRSEVMIRSNGRALYHGTVRDGHVPAETTGVAPRGTGRDLGEARGSRLASARAPEGAAAVADASRGTAAEAA